MDAHPGGLKVDNNLGKMLKKYREAKGLTLGQVSKDSGVSESHVRRIEKGERSPGSAILFKLEKALGFEKLHKEESLESLYGLKKKDVELVRVQTKSGKWLELFKSPGNIIVDIDFPEFTCRCPRTGQPDFANINIKYLPGEWCVELKSLKYYLNSFRDEGHFHEAVTYTIEQDLRSILEPVKLRVEGEFNTRGGMQPTITAGDDLGI